MSNSFVFLKIVNEITCQVAWNVELDLVIEVAEKQVQHNTSEKVER